MTTPPTLCFVGHALGVHPGWITTQAEVVADLFEADGHPVRITSRQISRFRRAADTVSCLVRWRATIDVAIVSVFSGGAFAQADLASEAARALGLPTVLWLHGGNLPRFIDRHPTWARRVLHRADAIVAPSDYLARPVRAQGAAVEVIANVVDLTRCPYRARPSLAPRLLWMRTFQEDYNPVMAVTALHELRRTHPDATLTMAGQDDGFLDQTRAAAGRLGVADAVDFVGFLDAETKPAVFAAHDIYLHTNHIDNTPVSVIEAGAFGLPIIATDVGGLADLVTHGASALLVADDDALAMAVAVRRLLGDPDLARRLSAGGRAMADESAWTEVAPQWLELCGRVIAAHAGGSGGDGREQPGGGAG